MQSVYYLCPIGSIQSVLAGKHKRNWNPSGQGETKAVSRLPGQGAPIWATRGQLGLVPDLEAKALPVSERFPLGCCIKRPWLIPLFFLFLLLSDAHLILKITIGPMEALYFSCSTDEEMGPALSNSSWCQGQQWPSRDSKAGSLAAEPSHILSVLPPIDCELLHFPAFFVCLFGFHIINSLIRGFHSL